MKLSVIIVNYNVEYFLEQCLNSVLKASEGIEYEIIVVDNASVDGSLDMMQRRFPDVHLIANKDNRGFSKANNQGILESKGEYVLLLNPDTVVEEETFTTCLEFMEKHENTGGLGIKMLDGKGNFLPESKRGLPTPSVAFYKIFGLSSLFPRSKKFNRYHLGHLDPDSIHEVEILSGAFMFLRRSALDEVGLLDEDYFMYGEDIDLSYRLIKGGFKNYYLPHTRIIHYKGESTKKTSINYVLVFYNAMRIFARKHFSTQHARSYNKLIELAIYARAFLSLLKRFIQKLIHPLLDGILVVIILFLISSFYEQSIGVIFIERLLNLGLSTYAAIWVISAYLSSGYEYPLKDRRKIQGVAIGTAIILILYSLLPEDYRFSRAIILFGALASMIVMTLTNGIFRKFSPEANSKEDNAKKFMVIGGDVESSRIKSLMTEMGIHPDSIFSLAPSKDENFASKVLSMTEIYDIDEVIYCAKDMTAERIIDLMSSLDNKKLDYKIAPSESMFIIGSNSKDNSGDLLAFEVNSIGKPVNRRNKRLLDIIVSLILLVGSPFLIFAQRNSFGLLSNIISVSFGNKSWVGYHLKVAQHQRLPSLRNGILRPDTQIQLTDEQMKKSNLLYAKDYSINHDIDVIIKNWRNLGSQ
ncbi:MAG: glycosyltransferase [Flavobacteriales bacterium]|nr:glycosyltransferase [Flavobacteriales bacterium]